MPGKYWSRTQSSHHEWWWWCAADAVMMMVIMMMMVMMMTLMVILLLMMAGRVLRCYLATTCGTNAWRIEALRTSCVGGFSISFTEQCQQRTIDMIDFNIEKDVIYFVVTSTLADRDSLKPFTSLVFGPGEGGGGYSLVGVGCAARFFKYRPDFKPKHLIFHTRFQTRTLKSMPVFRPGL